PDGGLYPANGFVGRAAYNRAATFASSRAHVEELAVGEAHTLDQALAGSTENPLGVTRAPCTGAAADIVACPRGVSALALPIARGIAMDSDGSTRPHKRYNVFQQCFIIAKLDPPHVNRPALQALPFMQFAHGGLELIKPVKLTLASCMHSMASSIHRTRNSNELALANKRRYVPFNAGGIGHLISPILASLVELADHR
ncbi:hypothetical protein DYB28_004559, partial [Aphanomyces astaci]